MACEIHIRPRPTMEVGRSLRSEGVGEGGRLSSKKARLVSGLKLSGGEGGKRSGSAGRLSWLLFGNRRAANLVVFQHTARIANLERGGLLAVLEGDHDIAVGGVGGYGDEQGGDREALDQFGRRHFRGLRVALRVDSNVRLETGLTH